MKYKIGDKVKIRIEEYCRPSTRRKLERLHYTVRLKEISYSHNIYDPLYMMEEMDTCWWTDSSIIGLVVEEILDPIISRWEILDL